MMAQGPFVEQFAGKVAAITGGTQGLGEAAARLAIFPHTTPDTIRGSH
jgi:hypothetical protein